MGNKHTSIGEVLTWLFIFIAGSLIVTAMINPEFRNNIGNKISDSGDSMAGALSSTNIVEDNRVKLIPSEMEEHSGHVEDIKSCVYVETLAELSGISDPKEKLCKEACSWRDMEYSSVDCKKDLFSCYCKK